MEFRFGGTPAEVEEKKLTEIDVLQHKMSIVKAQFGDKEIPKTHPYWVMFQEHSDLLRKRKR